MNASILFPAVAPTGFQTPNHKARQVRFALLLLVIPLIFPITELAARAPSTGGGKPPPPAQILPVSLGVPPECSSTEGTGLNNGAYPGALVVTAITMGCASQYNRPYSWQGGSWHDLGTLPGATGGLALGVSDDGTVVGSLAGDSVGQAFVVKGGGAMAGLPLLSGMVHASADGISEDGTHIFGDNSTDTEWPAVRWNWNGSGWSVEEIGVGAPTGSTDDGSTMVGNWGGDRNAWVWLEGGSQQGLGDDSMANDVSPAGTMIVGFRWASCGTSCEYEIPVYWTVSGGTWVRHDLLALDGVDSRAQGVGEVGGKLVIVGFGYTKKDAIMRAVAWLPQSGGTYGAPIRLAALGGNSKFWATAADVNANGKVLGTSRVSGLNRAAVLWTLPTP